MNAAPTKAEVEASIARCRRARIHACGAWSDVIEGGNINERKCNEASKAEDELAAAIAELARLALDGSTAHGEPTDDEVAEAICAFFQPGGNRGDQGRMRRALEGFVRRRREAASGVAVPASDLEEAVREWNNSLPARTLGEVHIHTLLNRLSALGVQQPDGAKHG